MLKVVLGLLCLTSTSWSAEGDVIVRLSSGNDRSLQSQLTTGDQVEAIIPELGLYLVKPASVRSTRSLVESFRNSSGTTQAFADYKMQLRNLPSDTDFSKLWSLNPQSSVNIQATEAWSISTGGTNALGEQIVVAVVDGGFDTKHSDLVPNLWTNKNEVAGNGIDDDGNGYVDDIVGWNGYNNSGQLDVDLHGTHVAGTIGAKGNNQLGVVGVNWDIQMMMVGASSGSFSVVGKGYGYVLKMKKLWLESNGQKGANVVATNSSFGVDYADCQSSSYSVWNDIYNEMGKVGILSVAATANNRVDVDKVGDVPTGCNSPYVVSVTNTDAADVINSRAAWGLKTIDLGAPGTDIYSTVPNEKYSKNTGTSMATPHVAGAIGLMSAAASWEFIEATHDDPAGAALIMKEILLAATDANPSLAGRTVSGGRLNLGKAVTAIHRYQKPAQQGQTLLSSGH
jgi:subtilisin family serine protease